MSETPKDMNSTISSQNLNSTNKSSNPFRIPADEEVFMLRDEERRRRKEEREKLSKLPIHEKTTWTTRLKVQRFHDDRSMSRYKSYESYTPSIPIYKEKENMADFIEKKRQMFLLQMSLDTKKLEIEKLEAKAQEREKKLEEEERALNQRIKTFDEFLTLNDMKAMEAVNNAEEEMKQKTIKQNEIKKLMVKISNINNEIAKLDDQLEKCKRYKEFLDSLSPPEWLEAVKEKKRRAKEAKKKQAEKQEETPKQPTSQPSESQKEEEVLVDKKMPIIAPIIQTETKKEEKKEEEYDEVNNFL